MCMNRYACVCVCSIPQVRASQPLEHCCRGGTAHIVLPSLLLQAVHEVCLIISSGISHGQKILLSIFSKIFRDPPGFPENQHLIDLRYFPDLWTGPVSAVRFQGGKVKVESFRVIRQMKSLKCYWAKLDSSCSPLQPIISVTFSVVPNYDPSYFMHMYLC